MKTRNKERLRFTVNLVFSLYNCFLAVTTKSWWFLSAGAYYLILSTMRVAVVAFAAKDRKNEFFIQKFIGIMLFLLSIVLCGITYMSVYHDVAASHHEIVMITIALYAFTKITLALIGFFKSRKQAKPYVTVLQSITVTDAVVSIYSLQRSMLVSFGEMAQGDIILFNLLSGIGMCAIVIAIGLYLMIKKEKENG